METGPAALDVHGPFPVIPDVPELGEGRKKELIWYIQYAVR